MKVNLSHIIIFLFLVPGMQGQTQSLTDELLMVGKSFELLNNYEIIYKVKAGNGASSQIFVSKCEDRYFIESAEEKIIIDKTSQLSFSKSQGLAYYASGAIQSFDPMIIIKQIQPLLSIAEKINFISSFNGTNTYEIILHTAGLTRLQVSIDIANKKVAELIYDFENDNDDLSIQLSSFRTECTSTDKNNLETYLSYEDNRNPTLLAPYKDYRLFIAPSNQVK